MTPFFAPGPHRVAADPDLHRRREPLHLPARGRAVRRLPRPPVPLDQVSPTTSCFPNVERRAREVGADAHGPHVLDDRVRHHREERATSSSSAQGPGAASRSRSTPRRARTSASSRRTAGARRAIRLNEKAAKGDWAGDGVAHHRRDARRLRRAGSSSTTSPTCIKKKYTRRARSARLLHAARRARRRRRSGGALVRRAASSYRGACRRAAREPRDARGDSRPSAGRTWRRARAPRCAIFVAEPGEQAEPADHDRAGRMRDDRADREQAEPDVERMAHDARTGRARRARARAAGHARRPRCAECPPRAAGGAARPRPTTSAGPP